LKEYDVVLLHPPSIAYFRKKPFLSGPIHRTVPIYTPLFIMFPIGMISIASFLDERGINVKIINLAEKMLVDQSFDLELYIKSIKSKIYGIGLHWIVHVHGAIEVARICKSLHPESIIVLGGLTATCFADEIAEKFDFVDCVVRGEAEHPFYELVTNLKKYDKIKAFYNTPNLTFKTPDGRVISTTSCNVVDDIDEFSFTNLELVEPHMRTITSPLTGKKLWNLPFYRGCKLNCATCGGSRYAYSSLMNRRGIARRSPEKLLEDFMILDEKGINSIFLFQDPRYCGKNYVERFLKIFKGVRWSNIENVGIELFAPASKSYLEGLKACRIADNLGLSISPESASDIVRYLHGRKYTTDELLRTVYNSRELGLPIGVFFMLTLGFEDKYSLKNMALLMKKLLSINKEGSKNLGKVSTEFGPMILLDPGSLAFRDPEKYGYKLILKNITDYYHAMSLPHWSLWISYETKNFNRLELASIILDFWEIIINIKKYLGLISRERSDLEKLIVDFERAALQDIASTSSKSPADLEELAMEISEIAKDETLYRSYILTHNLGCENRVIDLSQLDGFY